MPLPLHATDASHKRYELAIQLVRSCPPELGDEIALTGSTARGLADDDSDLELNLWSETLLPVEARVAWLKAVGVEEIEVFERPRNDGSYWIGGRLNDVPLELGWQTYKAAEATVARLLSSRGQQRLGDILVTALALRTTGRLAEWQARLTTYSDDVQAKQIQSAVKEWSRRNNFRSMANLARRDERLALTDWYVTDLDMLLSLLYTINRRWRPSGKWELAVAHDLPLMPENWRERFDAVLTSPTVEGFRLLIELMLDALALVPPEYDVSGAIAALQEAKRSRGKQSP